MARHLSPGLKTPTGFLLIDYPGYGKCAGRSSRDAILRLLKRAQTLLQRHPAVRPAVERSLNGAGLFPGGGCGAGLATRYPTQHIVLLAPFTSIHDIASHLVVWPITTLLRERFDNIQALTTPSALYRGRDHYARRCRQCPPVAMGPLWLRPSPL